jgi:hypothetical protein
VTNWERDWALLTGWKRWLVVAGTYTLPSRTSASSPMKWGKDIGAGPSGLRSTDIARTHIRAFFDQHLKGKTRPLFSQPSDRYPEVTFHSQTGWTVRLTLPSRPPAHAAGHGTGPRLPDGFGDDLTFARLRSNKCAGGSG